MWGYIFVFSCVPSATNLYEQATKTFSFLLCQKVVFFQFCQIWNLPDNFKFNEYIGMLYNLSALVTFIWLLHTTKGLWNSFENLSLIVKTSAPEVSERGNSKTKNAHFWVLPGKVHLWQDVFYTLVSQNLYAVIVGFQINSNH